MTPERTISLDMIKAPVSEELDRFGSYFRQSMRSSVPLVDTIARYIVRQKGKRIRPLLVFLTAKACGQVNETTFRGATLVEILHTATLVHDDVVDDADARRGLASINAVWKNKVAVLMGDYLLATGLMLSLKNKDHEFLDTITSAVRRMSEGEILQIQKSRELNMDEATYLRIIADKTASLLSTCTEIGAVSASAGQRERALMKEFGEHVGMAFQIRDDILDFTSKQSVLGKPVGGDMKEKKITLPVIYAFLNAPRNESRRVISTIRKGISAKDVDSVVGFVRRYGGLDYALAKAQYYSGEAKQRLSALPPSPARSSLEMFVDYVMTRTT